MKLADDVAGLAAESPDGRYRFMLERDWSTGRRRRGVLWIMLNPSTAGADVDDPTLRRVQSFARRWGFDHLRVVNLFALRSTDPAALRTVADPVGVRNDDVILEHLRRESIELVVAAWGVHGRYRNRGAAVIAMAHSVGRPLSALGVTKDGFPRHPLYVAAETNTEAWR